MSDVDRRGPVDVRLLRLVPALRGHLVVIALAAVAMAVAVVTQAEVLAHALADLVQNGSIAGGLGTTMVALGVVAGVRGATVAVTEWSAARAMRATRSSVRDAIFDHAQLDVDHTSSGLASREATVATTGVDELEPYVRQFLPALTLALAVPLAAGARILFADPTSAALIALTVPLIPIFMVLIGRMTERRTQRQWAVLQRLGGHFLDVIEGLPTLRLFGRAEAQRDSVHEVSEQYRASTMQTLRIAFLSAFALELIATLSVALIAVEIGLRLAAGRLELTTALIVLLLTPECYLPLRRVGASFHAAQSGLDAADDLTELLARPALTAGRRPAPPSGTLELRGVQLTRGNRIVVTDIDLDVGHGSIVAVYGPTGAGKSTLIDACRARLADRHGSIGIDGVDVREFDADSWADQLAVIGQRLVPLGGSVADDVRAGSVADDELIAAALVDVGLAGIGRRRSDELSGGQLRRVQVARAIVAVRSGRARFVFADEPTAHLDDASADLVWSAIAALAAVNGAGVLVATHDDRCRRIATQVFEVGASVTQRPEAAPAPPDRAVIVLDAPVSNHDDRRGRSHAPATAPSRGELWTATRRIMRMARPARPLLAGATLLGAAAEICTLGLAGVAAWLVVRASERPDLAELSIAILAVRAFGIGKGAFRYGERLAAHDAGLRSLSEVRAAVVDRLADIAPAGIPGWERGDVLQRVVSDVDRILDLFVRILGPVTAVALTAGGATVITLFLDPAAGLVLAVALTVVGIGVPMLTVVGETHVGPGLARARARLAASALGFTESLDALIASRLQTSARRAVDDAGRDVDDLAGRRAVVRMYGGAALAAAPIVTAMVTLAVVAPSTATLSGPVLGVLVLWPLAIVELVTTVNEAAVTLPGVAGSAQRVMAIIDLPGPVESSSKQHIGRRPHVTVEALTARWTDDDHDAVGPVSFDLPPATHLTIAGPSGSGKSTLAATLVGFLAPSDGRYLIDATSAAEWGGTAVRERVTWVQQLPWLADSTVRENLRLADPAAGDDELVEVLRAVRLDGWLATLADGLDSRMGRSGAGMSGGEAQRLALARVLLADHRVVVLDEPTANLDAATAELVLDTVLDRFADRTTVILGHRDS